MKQKTRSLPVRLPFFVAIGFVTGFTSFALTTDMPYQPIVERNVFALKPPTPPPTTAPEVVTPPPNVELRGISTLFGRPQVLLTIKTAAKPPEPPKDQAVILDVGQREGDVEVLEINPATGSVRLRNQGKEIPLTLADNAAKPTATAAPVTALPPAAGALTLPTPKLPSPASPSLPNLPQYNTGGAGGTAPAGIRTPPSLPPRSLRSGGNSLPNQVQDDARTLPLEAQHALIEIERERTREAVEAGRMPPLPPIPTR